MAPLVVGSRRLTAHLEFLRALNQELLAGHQLVDAESEVRAIEIAARVSAAPGPSFMAVASHLFDN